MEPFHICESVKFKGKDCFGVRRFFSFLFTPPIGYFSSNSRVDAARKKEENNNKNEDYYYYFNNNNNHNNYKNDNNKNKRNTNNYRNRKKKHAEPIIQRGVLYL